MRNIIKTFVSAIAVSVAFLSSCTKDNGGNDDKLPPEELNTDALVYYLTEMDNLLAIEEKPENGYTQEAFDALKSARKALEEAISNASDGTFSSQQQVDDAASAAETAIKAFKDSYEFVKRAAELYIPGATDVSNYIEFGEPGAFDGYQTISVEFWFKGTENMNNQQQGSIISNFYAPGNNGFYGWEVNTWANSSAGEGPYKIRVSRGFSQGLIELQPMYENYTEWHHIAYTHDNGTRTSVLYCDGKIIAQSGTGEWPVINSDPLSPDHDIQMCGFKNLTDANNPKAVSGSMKKVRFWDYALTKEEVKTNMQEDVTGKENGLIAAWDFTETVENPLDIQDKTGKHIAKVIGDKVEWRKTE